MKFEFKTEKDNYFRSFNIVFRSIFSIALIVTFCDIASKLGIISRHYQIDYNCRLLSLEKSKSNFKKLSTLTRLKSKQKVWEFCKEIVK